MAKLSMNYFSNALRRNIEINVLLPIDNFDYGMGEYVSNRKFKTLYLLHGIYGCNMDWITHSNLMSYLAKYNLAVVLPSGENSFYVDNTRTNVMYSKFIGEELPMITRRAFPLSDKKEDTFIAGLSMGGFGALINGVKYNETFSVVGAFSSAIPNELDSGDLFPNYDFGIDYKDLAHYERDQFDLLNLIQRNRDNLPEFYLTCGTEDFIYDKTETFVASLDAMKVPYEYHEWSGEHSWEFWDQSIKMFLEHLDKKKTL